MTNSPKTNEKDTETIIGEKVERLDEHDASEDDSIELIARAVVEDGGESGVAELLEIIDDDIQEDDYDDEEVYEPLSVIDPESDPYISASTSSLYRSSKTLPFKVNTVVVVSIIAAILVVVAAIFIVWFDSLNMSEEKVAERTYVEKLQDRLKGTEEAYEELESRCRRVLESPYDDTKVRKALYDIEEYEKKNPKEDYFDPYSGEYLKGYENQLDTLQGLYDRISQMLVEHCQNEIASLSVDEKRYQAALAYMGSEDKSIEYEHEDLQKLEATLTSAYTLSQNLISDETLYAVMNVEDYSKAADDLSTLVSKCETLYQAALMKECYVQGDMRAQEQFDEKLEELKEQVRSEITDEVTEEVTDRLNRSHSQEIEGKDSRISSLEGQLADANAKVSALQKQIESMQNKEEQ